MMSRARGEGGSVALELAILTPALLVLLFVVVAAGRISSAKNDVTNAAADAARAGSLRRTQGAAVDDAVAVAKANLADAAASCTDAGDVAVDVSDLRPGGRVAVTVTCRVPLADLVLLGIPGTKSLVSRSVAVVDTSRSS